MNFRRVNTSADGLPDLTNSLARELANGRHVLWLISGGSNIGLVVDVMKQLPSDNQHLLSVMLADERYGEVGHPDSNFQQLLNAGFNPGEAQVIEILQPGLSFFDTEQRFKSLANEHFDQADVIIAQLGIGGDGHIAGILPHSPAAREEIELVKAYESQPYKRLSLTFPALRRVNLAYVFAFGESKLGALTNLRHKQLSLNDQPSQILKQINEAYVYNDLVD